MNIQDIYIVNENPMLIQKLCKDHSRGSFNKYFIGILIVSILSNWIPNILSVFLPTSMTEYMDMSSMGDYANIMPQIPLIFAFYTFVFNGVLQLGQALYVLTYLRNRSTEPSAIFESFSFYFKAFKISIFQTLICTMWAMLFVIPGIIAAYGFRQSYFIIADDPSKGSLQCMAESKLRMTGNKMNLFRLDLTYFPYIFIGYFIQNMIYYVPSIDFSSLQGTIIALVASIPFVWATAKWSLGEAAFYELMISRGFNNFRYAGQDAFRQTVSHDSTEI